MRRRARVALAARGLATLAVALVAACLVSWTADRSFHLAWGTRAGLLALGLAGGVALAWRRLGRPLATPLPDAELARLVEARHPLLEWRLLSAVQFADPAWAPGPHASRELARAVLEDAEARAATVDFAGTVPAGPPAKAGGRGAVVLLAAGLLVATFPDEARTWLARNVLLSRAARWPQATFLALELDGGPPGPDGVIKRAQGEDLGVSVVASGVVPRRVVLEAVGLEPGAPRETIVLDALGQGRFRTVLERVAGSFRLEVRGGDDALGPFEVRVVPRPWLEALALEVTPPAYTGLPARTLGVEAASVSLPAGTRLRVTARASKPLAGAWLVERGGAGAGEPGPGQGEVRHEAALTGEGAGPREFVVELSVERAALLELHVLDADGWDLAEPPRLGVVALADRAPEVTLALRGVGPSVTPQATLPARVLAKDDHGVRAGALRLRATGGEAPAQPAAPPPGGGEAPPGGEAPGAGPVAGVAAETSHALALPDLTGHEAAAERRVSLAELGLRPKASLSVWGEATDGDPRGPNVGSSPTVHLRVVTPEQLLNDLLRRMHELRLELERLADEEERLAVALGKAEPAALERAPRAQRDVERSVGRGADGLEQLTDELEVNALLDASAWRRLRELALAMRQTRDGAVARARDLAEAAVLAPEEGDPPPRQQAAREAGRAATRAGAELRDLAGRLGRVEELAELVAALKGIIERQRELLDRTRRELGGRGGR